MSGQLKKSFVEDVASNWHMAYHVATERKAGVQGSNGGSQVYFVRILDWQCWRDVICHILYIV